MADDIVTDLRYCAEIHAGSVRHECIADAADLLEAIDALHQCDPALGYECAECFHVWPCPTALLLHPEEARRG